MDGCPRQNPAYRPATENPRNSGGSLFMAPAGSLGERSGEVRPGGMVRLRGAGHPAASRGGGARGPLLRLVGDRVCRALDAGLRPATSGGESRQRKDGGRELSEPRRAADETPRGTGCVSSARRRCGRSGGRGGRSHGPRTQSGRRRLDLGCGRRESLPGARRRPFSRRRRLEGDGSSRRPRSSRAGRDRSGTRANLRLGRRYRWRWM